MSGRGPEIAVIGAGIGGLASAAILARAGYPVTVFEARDEVGERADAAQALYAFDPQLMTMLNLARRGLRFAVRDMPLVGLRPDGRHIVISRDGHATARALALHSKQDAKAWPRMHGEFQALARALRRQWWDAEAGEVPSQLRARLTQIRRMGAAAWLDSQFESEAVKAVLAFDSTSGGLSPLEPGSALTLLWRAAQEMCGLQGAVALPQGGVGALVAALAAAARDAGANIHLGARVARIRVDDNRAAGVELASGEFLPAGVVLSCLSRRQTLDDLLPDAEAGFDALAACERAAPAVSAAQIVLTLDKQLVFGGIATPANARFVLADSVESHIAAHAAAQAGHLPHEAVMEVTFPSASNSSRAANGHHALSALIRPLPMAPVGGWEALKPQLLDMVTRALSPYGPDLAAHVVNAEIATPQDFRDAFGVDDVASGAARILAGWKTRIATPVEGLMLCGAAAEPVAALSGRAGRIAAQFVREGALR